MLTSYDIYGNEGLAVIFFQNSYLSYYYILFASAYSLHKNPFSSMIFDYDYIVRSNRINPLLILHTSFLYCIELNPLDSNILIYPSPF